MTHKEPDEGLRRELEQSREYFESEGARGASVSLSFERLEGVDLSDAVLVGGHLHEAVFDKSRLVNARLMGADAPGASFDDTDADGIDLAKAELEQASFRNARMARAVLRRARLRGATLDRADLRGADFFAAKASNTSLRGAQLVGATLEAAILAGADLRDADVTDVKFERTLVDEQTQLRGLQGLQRANIVSVIAPEGEIRGWAAAGWLARRAITVPPLVAFQGYLLGQMSSDDLVSRGMGMLGLARDAVATMRALLGKIFDVPGHATDEYERWLGPPAGSGAVHVDGTFAGSTRSWWYLPLWPELRFGVSTHPDGYAWDMRFEGGAGVDPPVVGSTTFDRLPAVGARTEEVEAWPPMREVITTLPDGRGYEMRFDYDLLQSVKRLGAE